MISGLARLLKDICLIVGSQFLTFENLLVIEENSGKVYLCIFVTDVYPSASVSSSVRDTGEEESQALTFHGIILRSQLVTLLKRGVFYSENSQVNPVTSFCIILYGLKWLEVKLEIQLYSTLNPALTVGGGRAQWLAHWSPDRVVQMKGLAGECVLVWCSWTRCF